jgi:hypothetical protein
MRDSVQLLFLYEPGGDDIKMQMAHILSCWDERGPYLQVDGR